MHKGKMSDLAAAWQRMQDISDDQVLETLRTARRPTPLAGASEPIAERMSIRDEAYILDLCDDVLGVSARRQHRFDFLIGDSGRRLPVDAYYPSFNVVVEYRERQHFEAVAHFDRRSTVSGISRGAQRAKYDERRRSILPTRGIELVEIAHHEFACNGAGRLRRDAAADRVVLEGRLGRFRDAGQRCPICRVQVEANGRYPRYLCDACSSRTVDAFGRGLSFRNTSLGGGLAAADVASGQSHDCQACFVDGVPCWADEARFGGIVVQAIDRQIVASLIEANASRRGNHVGSD